MLSIHAKYHKCQEHYLGYDLYMYVTSTRPVREAKYGRWVRHRSYDRVVIWVMVN